MDALVSPNSENGSVTSSMPAFVFLFRHFIPSISLLALLVYGYFNIDSWSHCVEFLWWSVGSLCA